MLEYLLFHNDNIIAIIISFTIFWMLFFMISLSVGLKMPSDSEIITGNAASAPTNPRMKLRIMCSFCLAIIACAVYIYIINHYPNLINLKE